MLACAHLIRRRYLYCKFTCCILVNVLAVDFIGLQNGRVLVSGVCLSVLALQPALYGSTHRSNPKETQTPISGSRVEYEYSTSRFIHSSRDPNMTADKSRDQHEHIVEYRLA